MRRHHHPRSALTPHASSVQAGGFQSPGLSSPNLEPLEPRTHFSVSISSDGWTEFRPRDDDRTIYVSTTEGSDDNGGTSTTKPVKSLAKAISLLRDGSGDQMLLKNGDVWYENIPDWTKSGRSADEPLIIGAYGPGDRPVLETGGDSGINFGNMTIKHVAINGIYFHANTRDPDSPDYTSPKANQYGAFGMHSAYPVDDLLIENCVFKSYQFNVVIEGQFIGQGGNVKLRRNVISDAYSTVGRSEGLYIYNMNNVLLEDNIFDHNGWNEKVKGAEATIFNHNAYLAAENTGVVVRGNVFSNASSHGLQARSGGKIQGNLFLRNPIGLLFGIGRTVVEGGSEGDVSGNVFLGTTSINGQVRGWGLELGNIKRGGTTVVRNNIFAQDTQRAFPAIVLTTGGGIVANSSDAVGVNDLLIENNIVYKWFKGLHIDSSLYSGGAGQNALSDLVVRNNDFQRMFANQMITSGSDIDPKEEKFSSNRYDNDGDTRYWFTNKDQTVSWDTWYEKIDSTSTRRKMKYFNPERTVETYNVALGGKPSIGAFMTEARRQSRRYWRDNYTTESVIEYVREGFKLKGVAPAITATNLSAKNTRPLKSQMTFFFNTDVSANLSASDLQITDVATGQKIEDWKIHLDYDTNTNIATFTFPNGELAPGLYDITLASANVTDSRNVPLDGDYNNTPGGDFTRRVRIR
ncbi:MAG TPA: right-handed parallel beta-helix repeat-containing protein [Tepidisphaeraceae bacterium]